MSDIIHLLPDNIANQIAAGEVIQRPASVVKELVENSIDAGATNIQVIIKDAGRTLIQVIDNGKGMSATDARMAFERHATSKISSADDLFSLRTMGFRGEALASIVAVSQVELRTREKNAELGTVLNYIGSNLESAEENSCNFGSVFSVKNLFFNVPARRKFLKSNETEFRAIITEFERVALVNPEIAMSLSHNGIEVFDLHQTIFRQRIIDIYGKNLNPKLLSLDVKSSLASISGFVGTPDSSRKRGALQYFFVNGRFMKHPYFHKAVVQAFDQLIPSTDQPNYFIYFTLDPSSIDVNIHPTKTEIKFENEQPIWQILMAAIREALAKASAVPTLDFDEAGKIDIPIYNPNNASQELHVPKVDVNPNYNPFRSGSYSHGKRENSDWTKLYTDINKDLPTTESVPENLIPDEDVTVDVANLYHQYKGRYIITALKSGLAIIDQHRAHIRILFDRYISNIRQQRGASQQVLFPEVVELTPEEASVFPSLLSDMHYMGFDLVKVDNNNYAIKGVPSGLKNSNITELIKDMADKAMETGCEVQEEIGEALALSLAKSSAVPAGKNLSTAEMDQMVASLFSCPEPNLTPEGQTIISLLTDEEFEKRFG